MKTIAGQTDAMDWAERMKAEAPYADRSRRAAKTRKANAAANPKPRSCPWNPERDKPAKAYVSVNYDPSIFPEEIRDFANYFLDQILWGWYGNRSDEAGYTYLKNEYLRKFIPRQRLREIRAKLLQHGIITCDNHVRWGKCLGYKLQPDYWLAHAVPYQNETLNRKIRDRAAANESTLQPVHRWLKSKLDFLDVDLERALEIVSTLEPDPDTPMTSGDYRAMLVSGCQRLADGDRRFTADRYGRVHTDITSLRKELRCCLSVHGQPLQGWDMANSQPLIAGIVSRHYLAGKRMAQWRMRNRKFPEGVNPYLATTNAMALKRQFGDKGDGCTSSKPPPSTTSHPTQHPITMAGHPPNQVKNRVCRGGVSDTNCVPPDLVEFLTLCEQGKFYDSFGADRDRVKSGMWPVFFGKKNWTGPIKTDLESKYPSVAGTIRALKSKDYRRAAWTLQSWESALFIHRICGTIREERPTMPVFTIHDALLTAPTKEYPDALAYVKVVILAAFAELGIHPTVKPI